jgi:hypothetical protein
LTTGGDAVDNIHSFGYAQVNKQKKEDKQA